MLYNRLWFHRDHYGLTIGGGRINNPGRYLVLLPPINGATAASGTPYFTEVRGTRSKAWARPQRSTGCQPIYYVPFGNSTIGRRMYRIFRGPGGVTPTSCPTAPVVENICGSPGALVPSFTPDLKKD